MPVAFAAFTDAYSSCLSATSSCLAPLEFCSFNKAHHRLDEMVPIDKLTTEYFYIDYLNVVSKKKYMDDGPTNGEDDENVPVGSNSPNQKIHHTSEVKGIVVIAVFLMAFFVVLTKIFRKKPAALATARPEYEMERQSLTRTA